MPSIAAVLGAEVVRVVEGVEHLVRDPRGEVLLDPAPPRRELPQQRQDIDPVDVLHRDEQGVIDFAQLEGLRDLGVDEARRELRLVDEHRVVGLVADEVRQQPLDHDLLREAVLARRGRDEQLGHAADGQPFDELVPAKADRKFAHRSTIVSQPPVA